MTPIRVFAYGSLIWRPGFAALRRERAVLPGWARRFWQASTDHRGFPHAPGRVVTLVRDDVARCEGFAFEIDAASADDVLAALDVRESGGYERTRVALQRPDGAALGDAWVWIAHPGNPHWAGGEHDDAVIAQIHHAVGPSGANLEYVLALADALVAEGIDDDEVEGLAARLRAR